MTTYTHHTSIRKKQKVITNALVACIGISKYNKSIPDIVDVKHDISQYNKILSHYYKYKVISNEYNQFCSKNMIQNFLNDVCQKYSINDNDKIFFNGLIITICAHCNQDSLLCSDGEYIKFNDILSIFTKRNKHLALNIPKLLIVDGNRGYVFPESDTQTQLKTLNYTGIIRSSSTTNSLAYGHISWNVCQIFAQYKDRHGGILFYDIITELKQRLSQSIYRRDAFSFIADANINMVAFRANKQNTNATTHSKIGAARTRYRALSAPVSIPLKPPSIRVPPMQFLDKDKWNKTLKIVTKEFEKTRVKIEWLFMVNNKLHNAVMTHSQKRKSWIPSSRAFFIDGIKVYSNRSRDCIFIKKIDGHSLKFKIQCIDDKYRYLMSIDKIPHQIAYQRWKLHQININTNKGYKSENNRGKTKNKSNWLKSKTKSPAFHPLFNYVPDVSVDSDDNY